MNIFRSKRVIGCARCKGVLREDDAYCRNCGSKREEKLYRPENERIQCLYGPPMTTVHTCKNCNITWTRRGLGTGSDNYCIKCGNKLEKEIK